MSARFVYHLKMSNDCDLSPTSFACCLCLEDNKCDEPDDPRTYDAYLEWIKVHRTNYLESPVLFSICARHHMCSAELYASLRNQAIEKRGLGTYTIACPVLGCSESLVTTPTRRRVWDVLIKVCTHGHMLDYNCYMKLARSGTRVCPMCRDVFHAEHAHCIPTASGTTKRKLDRVKKYLDRVSQSEQYKLGLQGYADFASVIQGIFVEPQHVLHVSGEPQRVALVFLLTNTSKSYEAIREFVQQFLAEWAAVLDVMNIVAPCGIDAFVPILNCIDEGVIRITKRTPGMTASQKSVLAQLQLVAKIFELANTYVQRTWYATFNYHIAQDVPESPQPPDVACQDG